MEHNGQLENNDECSDCTKPEVKQIAEIKKRRNTAFLIVLCTCTIAGSLFGILRGVFYQELASSNEYYRGWIYIATNLGTGVGAFLMIYSRNILGLYAYSLCQILYLATVFIARFSYDDVKYLGDLSELASFISTLFLIPSFLFLILYWLPINRKCLS
ncbi:hypothetical protein GCM10022393_18420 [Aquimarina addita]|uniref:Uncharacterized protein n=1 Tax=Aquimarina addita TaxID=870485 RepID=A0ABP6UH94_9FLAO